MNRRSLLAFLLSFIPLFLFSQEYSYVHYDSKEGLASSTVYCMVQDKEGFLWFGTEAGLSRFDGTHFKTFTQEDGLPDNEIIQLFADSKGRIWISPFKKTICYYYRGVFHTSSNDTLLQKLHIQNSVVRFAEDQEGNILLEEISRLHLIQTNGEVRTITTIDDKPFEYLTNIGRRKDGGFWVMIDGNVYSFHQGRFLHWKTLGNVYAHLHFNYAGMNYERLVWRRAQNEVDVLSLEDNKITRYSYPKVSELVNAVIVDERYSVACTLQGVLVYDQNYPDSIQKHLAGIAVSNVFKDSESNWWFCTVGKGVYRLNSSVVFNVQLTEKEDRWYSIKKNIYGSKEWKQAYGTFNLVKKYAAQNGIWENKPGFAWYTHIPIFSVLTLKDNSVALGTKFFMERLTPDYTKILAETSPVMVKAMCAYGQDILVATDRCVVRVNEADLKIKDTIWNERATCVLSCSDTIYIGTLNGFYQIEPDKRIISVGERIPALQGRIASVAKDGNNVIWVATTGLGLFGYRNGALVKAITHRDGLSSNICRTLFYENGQLWVGTDKGVSRISVLSPEYTIQKYSSSDGLASDIIDAIYVANKKVFIGTPEGITFFDEQKMTSRSRCDLRFVDITVGGKTYYPDDSPVSIPHKQNNILFNYVGISYKSGSEIRYRYRLLGLDSVWHETSETFLSYPTLPSGDYELQLQAINKFDVTSQLLTRQFTIEKLLHEKTWFRVVIVLFSMAMTSLLVWLLSRRIRKREQEKTMFVKRINELEQLSRKAQMNPHFIFNSLNSIQQYVMDADVAGANKFISGFSRLIRQTLDFSSKTEISLEEELDYLTNYLEIEKTRLEGAFSWAVHIDKAVNPAEYYIPPMILQPFVENSVRHGLRFRKDKKGVVTITVKRQDDQLILILEDNGIGRKAAQQYKSVSPINYQSKGLSLTADRIAMFNQEHAQKITMQIDDLEDEMHIALGTRVTISFPVS